MIRLQTLLSEATNPLEGKSKRNASNFVYNKVNKFIINGIFNDEYWQPIQKIFKEFNRLGLQWHLTGSKYEQERGVPVRKIWSFEIEFTNRDFREDKLYGQIVAAGSGPVEDPLDRYDVTLTLS